MNSPDTTYTTFTVSMVEDVKPELSYFEEILIPAEQKSDAGIQTQSFGKTDKNDWPEAPTKMLLALMKELLPQVGTSLELKTKSKMWNIISKKLSEEGYICTHQQVENKYYSLERRYKRKNGKNWAYENDVAELLAYRGSIPADDNSACSQQDSQEADVQLTFTGNHIEEVLSNVANKPDHLTSAVIEDPFIAIDVKAPSNAANERPKVLCSTNKNLKKKMHILSKKCEELAKSNKKFEEKVLHYLEAREEREKRKEERAEREEERKKRKLELFEKLVDKLTV